jgi:DNA repair protein RadC
MFKRRKEIAMHVDRFAIAQLLTLKEAVSATGTDLEVLLKKWGLTNSTQEELWVVTYDSIEQLRIVQEVAKGGYHELMVPLPPLLTAVLLSGTDRFKIVHNHPSGDTSPTNLDVELTGMLMVAANTLGLFFEDHLIVGPNADTYSFLEHGLIIPAVQTVRMSTGTGHQRAKAS